MAQYAEEDALGRVLNVNTRGLTVTGPVALNLGSAVNTVSLNDQTGTIGYASLFGGSGSGNGRLYLQGGDIFFGRLGANNTSNTTLTCSAAAANSDVLAIGGSLSLPIASGTGSIAVLSNTVTINCPIVLANSKIFLSKKGAGVSTPAAGPAQATLTYSAIVPGVSFTVGSVNLLGQAENVVAGGPLTFDWLVIN